MAGGSDTKNLLVLIGGVLLTTFVLGLWANTAQWVGLKAVKSSPSLLGADAEAAEHPCPHCNGTGKGPCWSCTLTPRPSTTPGGGPAGWCPTCLGVGKTKCGWCGGEGKLRSVLPVFGPASQGTKR